MTPPLDDAGRWRRPGGTLWLTGLPGAGKTTLAAATQRLLDIRGWPGLVLDGDVLRRGLSSDLSLSARHRAEQARRAAHVAALVSQAGVPAIVALVSPYLDDRCRAREIHAALDLPFFEVWVDTPLDVCERRDPKGLYSRARAGEIHEMTGVDAPYEPPDHPDLRVVGHGEDPDATARRLVALLALSSLPAFGHPRRHHE
jgi:bifunctional enzyme CysN/CysC